MDNYRIILASLPDREKIVAEIYFNNTQLAEISNEMDEFMIELYNESNLVHKARFNDFLSIIVAAKERLMD